MTRSSPRLQALATLLRAEWRQLTTVQPSDRLWQLPLAAAFATGLPLLAGAALQQLGLGLVASLGGLVLLHTPDTPLHHRLVQLMSCAFALTACYALGALSHGAGGPAWPVLVLVAITMMVMMLTRFYALGPPGGLFFVMVAAIGAYSPVALAQVPQRAGLVFGGALLGCALAVAYSLHALRVRPARPPAPLPPPDFDWVVTDAVLIGLFVGLSLGLAMALQLQRPYWVVVSCLAVIQGASLRAVWNKQLQRILGTGAGLLVAWALLQLPLTPWGIVLTMMALTFVIETLVVRHYGFAVVFITPLTLLLAEAATLASEPAHAAGPLVQARFVDTLVGCVVGLAGGACLHHAGLRRGAGRALRHVLCLPGARTRS